MAGEPVDPHATAITRRYADAAVRSTGCDPCACGPDSTAFGSSLYAGDEPGGLLSLGCGNPVAVAELRPGETVLDLGSGAGLDLLLSARRVGPAGRVIGLDMTEEMVALARRNTAGVGTVEIHLGRIEQIPLADASVDVVISNCVLNLSADKAAVLREVARVLRPGGRLGVSDLLADEGADLAAAAGALGVGVRPLTAGEYRRQLAAAGLADVRIEPAHAACPGITAAVVRASSPAPAGQAGGPAAAGQAGGPAAAGQVPEAAAVSAGGPAAGQVPAAAVVRAGGAAAADRAGGAAVVVRTMRDGDWPAVVAIYAEGIATGDATFETEPPTWAQWDTTHLAEHRLVAVDGDRVLGWTAVGRVSDRCAYAGVVENSIYVAASAQRRGVGRALLDALIASTEAAGIWTIQTGVFPENEPSLALHRAAGFRVVGVRERPGRLRGRWRDVVLLERRSAVSGS